MTYTKIDMKKVFLLLSLLTISLVATSPFAQAKQDLPPPPPGVSGQLQGLFGGTLKAPATKGAASNAPVPSTKFKSSGKIIITDVVIGSLKLEAEQEKAMRQFIPQVVGAIEQAYVANGYTKNDLGVSLGALLEACYEVHTGTFSLDDSPKDKATEEKEKKQTKALITQVQRALGGTAAFAKIPDVDKQKAYEMCTFQLGYIAVTWQQAGEDEAQKDTVRDLVKQLFTSLFNIDVDQITRSVTGELIPKPGAKPKQTQTTKPIDDDDEGAPPPTRKIK
jgi:hypothetical protein